MVTQPSVLPASGPISPYFSAIDWSLFLDRPTFEANCCDRRNFLSGKNVLITGAGGSIGSALALSLINGPPRKVIFLDHSEHNLQALYREFQHRSAVVPAEFVYGDILSRDLLEDLFFEHNPDIVFHAAALKHLPELESDPFSALENNVLGTIRLLETIGRHPVECFINVSTDKAVNPTSVLGVSKRLVELLLVATASSPPRKISLRLGNVLGSSGSVVPIFLKALHSRERLSVTDARASRYFLTLEEAAAFLMKSVELAAGPVMLPEMGKPRKITDLARFLLDQFDRSDESRAMRFVGLRDGEKCDEQLTYDYENLHQTGAPGIYDVSGSTVRDPEALNADLGRLLELVGRRQKSGLIDCLSGLVPEFSPSPTLQHYLC